ncbi:polysaccharide transporter, PST family [Flavobacterium gillisiae]|uniref:Polysaccharide transporter, PST family n=1 Tax=Flavobacterium gillisiae TaxID=150146 RepID=A0A1H4ERC0_9FLAO|nr:O-antigen translocase [Flavobacterium gillisiae]SEA87060.1 polysaccharide transporter, PST family [Flavobacterium gillisiae]
MSNDSGTYKEIFKSTFLFGFVQVLNIISKVGINKAVAIFLGAEGLGVISLYQSTINLIASASGLGISQSAVRDISEANSESDGVRLSRTIEITTKIIWFTALFGAVVTLFMSKLLSKWTFGNEDYVIPFCWLSIVVFLNVLSEGKLAVLKGMRELRALAKASLLGSLVGLISGVPFYYFLGYEGVLPSLITTALSTLFFSWFYVRKIKYTAVELSFKKSFREASGMIKMGVALMYVSFLGFITDYIIRIYISNNSSLQMVGFFVAGSTIISSYFGIIINAMSTDYYPRISAISNDDRRLAEEVNKQSEVGLILVGPLVVLFMFVLPLMIKILYTENFLVSIDYISYAIFGTLILVCSNSMGMVLLAKQRSNVFVYSVTFSRLLGIILNILSFKYFGLIGLGIAAIIMAIIHIVLMAIIMFKLYKITFKPELIVMLFITIGLCILAFFVKDFSNIFTRYASGSLLFIVSLLYSVYNTNRVMNINVIGVITSKFNKND